MTQYIVLLRGINVGGKNIIRMPELRQLLTSLGYQDVRSYIQSGNLLLWSDQEENMLSARIAQAILERFGVCTRPILRTAGELSALVEALPFSAAQITQAESGTDVEVLYVALLSRVPDPKRADELMACAGQSEQCRVIGRDAFLLLQRGIRGSKLVAQLGKLDAGVTMRNWKTITKLNELAH